MEEKIEIPCRFAHDQLTPSRVGLLAGLLLAGRIKSGRLAFTFSEKMASWGAAEASRGADRTRPG